MSFSVNIDTVDVNTVKVFLEGELTVREAASVKAAFVTLLNQYTKAQINLDGIFRIDIAGFQLLAALKKSAAAAGTSVNITFSSSENIRAALSLSGFTHLLSA